uniref:Uncharacterized protein n=1 Tax=Pseudonaja textilis TaxID=8673 RepID=A0A670YEI2_PSETE
METAAEENREQRQEKKVITRPEMEIGRYQWIHKSSRLHQYHHVRTLKLPVCGPDVSRAGHTHAQYSEGGKSPNMSCDIAMTT